MTTKPMILLEGETDWTLVLGHDPDTCEHPFWDVCAYRAGGVEIQEIRHQGADWALRQAAQMRGGTPDGPCWIVVDGTIRGQKHRGVAAWDGLLAWPMGTKTETVGLSEVALPWPMDPGFRWRPIELDAKGEP